MTAEARVETAVEIYRHELAPMRRGRLRRVLVGTVDLVAAMVGGLLELSSAGDVLVVRRSDEREVLRVPGGPPEEAAQLMHHVGQQLATLSPAEFRKRWGIAE